jgi:hypothetical protein
MFYSNFLIDEKGEDSISPEELIRKFPRRGDYSTLNLYFGGVDMPFSFSYLPSPGGLSSVPWDGAYIFLKSVPNVYGLTQTGATTVHEVSSQPEFEFFMGNCIAHERIFSIGWPLDGPSTCFPIKNAKTVRSS